MDGMGGGSINADNEDNGDDNEEETGSNDDIISGYNEGGMGDIITDINSPELTPDMIAHEQKLLLLDATNHITMARAQQSLSQEKVAAAVVTDATDEVTHLKQMYTFIMDYIKHGIAGLQFTATRVYYFSPLSVYNLGMVNHAHVYGDGRMCEHMHCHVYH
jgi:hypothetical protein